MKIQERKLLADRVLAAIPPKKNAIPYLMEMLGIARESVYRRLRGEVPFTIDEMDVLSRELGFSVDELLGEAVERRALFRLGSGYTDSAEETFVNMYHLLRDSKVFSVVTPHREIVASLNRLYPVFSPGTGPLLKFFYYEWVHQIQNVPVTSRYADVVVPKRVYDAHNSVRWDVLFSSNMTLITERNMVVNTLRKLDYLFRLDFIMREEVADIKSDLVNVIDSMEALMAAGTHKGGEFNFYLSEFDVTQNSINVRVDDLMSSFYWVDPANMMVTIDENMCHFHRRWLHSLKKYSSSISSSNQALRSEFFANQRRFLDSIAV
ncbi:MAG: hypothetical protein LBL78_04160 [Prevotellaceae bacterium]|jgi:hypothetical protein|nr:hypothetical protein [Prevotellaceae bacterium]